ncbi:unnamed protein product [Rotaria sp. Silwood1]|nr:unnamed protein product [Rotaria sp. Silwood1]
MQYLGSDYHLAKLNDFKKTYKPSDAIRWYTKEPFAYQFLNKALRTEDIDIVVAYRFLIRDINAQLNDEQLNYCIKLEERDFDQTLDKVIHSYRGQAMSIDELEKLRQCVTQYISISTFFSTNRNKHIALGFACSNEVADLNKTTTFIPMNCSDKS